MQAILVQPPFVQLNSPYPAVHYLEAFLAGRGISARSFDQSIELYRALFSRAGLSLVFRDARSAIGSGRVVPEGPAGREIARYLSYEPLWLEWVDGLVAFLSGQDPAFAHRMAAAAEFPRGARAEAFLEEAGGRITGGEARGLATAMLEDLADFIRFALDPDFGTVRYGDRLARSRGDFGEVLAGLDSAWFITSFYAPWLSAFWKDRSTESPGSPVLVLVTVPFPGCLPGALACARAARAELGARATVVLGGGYVSTELRDLADPRIFDFCDYLSFDAGYGSLASIVARLEGTEAGLWRTMYRRDGAVVREGFGDGGSGPEAQGGGTIAGESGADRQATGQPSWAPVERAALETVLPSYASADFGRYLRAVDSGNAMHRLWSDTPWLKYSLAHGCYWCRCSFCDTELDYVANFVPARVDAVMAAASAAAGRHALYGIHFVDEAMPMHSLLAFARLNRERAARGDRPFSFWGNVRFDASWTAGRAEYLAASGLVAVSGGIEIATERGLEITNKGFDLPALVRCLVGMRRAGLLVHAYLIYGFPGQAASDIVDSAEIVRQLFAAGLVDSAFWHRFVLTRNSRMMAEHRAGRLPALRPLDRGGSFADNDLEFEGEAAFDRFDAPLVAALESWMKGEELDRPASSWFQGPGGRGKFPTASAARDRVEGDRIERLVEAAEEAIDAERPALARTVHWIAGLPVALGRGGRGALSWACRGELCDLELPAPEARRVAEAVASLAARHEGMRLDAFLAEAGLGPDDDALGELMMRGLVQV